MLEQQRKENSPLIDLNGLGSILRAAITIALENPALAFPSRAGFDLMAAGLADAAFSPSPYRADPGVHNETGRKLAETVDSAFSQLNVPSSNFRSEITRAKTDQESQNTLAA